MKIYIINNENFVQQKIKPYVKYYCTGKGDLMCEIYFTGTPAKIKIGKIHEYFNYGYYSKQIGELIVKGIKIKYTINIFTNSKKEHTL
jgi:hypothetical protein